MTRRQLGRWHVVPVALAAALVVALRWYGTTEQGAATVPELSRDIEIEARLRSLESRIDHADRAARERDDDLRCLVELLERRRGPRDRQRIPSGYRWRGEWIQPVCEERW